MILIWTKKPEQVHRSFQDAFNRHDLEALCALYESEAVLVTCSSPKIHPF